MKVIKLLLLIALFMSIPSFAQDNANSLNGENLLNNLAHAFLNGANAYVEPLKTAASSLFWSLLGISLVITGINFAIKNDDIPSFLAVFVKLCINAGIFLFLLENGHDIGVSIIESLTGITDTQSLGPSELLDLSYNTFNLLTDSISNSKSSILLTCLMYIASYAYLVLNFLVVIDYTISYVSAYMLCILGVFCLGFGALEFTRNIAVSVLKQIIYFALRLMTMILICNSGFNVLKSMCNQLKEIESLTITNFNTIMFTSIFIFILTKKLPHLIGSLVLNVNFIGDSGISKVINTSIKVLK